MIGPKPHHDVHVMDETGKRLASRRLPEGLEGIGRLHELLAGAADEPGQVVIGIETDRGLWVQALTAAGYQVYAINPLAVARYRDRHNLAGAKSDAGDAKVLADLVRTDRHNHRSIAADSPDVEAVKVLARGHQNLIWARTRHTNQLRNSLREYFPSYRQPWAWLLGTPRSGPNPRRRGSVAVAVDPVVGGYVEGRVAVEEPGGH
jgi:transposase